MAMRTFGLCVLSFCPALLAQAPAADTQEMVMLADLGKLWGNIRTLHPDFATRTIDWDKALVDAIREIHSANNKTGYVLAVKKMLATLGDPATGLAEPQVPALVEMPKDIKPLTWLPDDTLCIHLNDPMKFINNGKQFIELLDQLVQAIKKSKRVIFDLRTGKNLASLPVGERMDSMYLQMLFNDLLPLLAEQPMALPAKRVRAHLGYRSEYEGTYSNGLLLHGGKVIQPSHPGAQRKFAFIVNDGTILPLEAMALKQAGKAFLVTEGTLHRDWSASTSEFTMTEGLSAKFKNADYVFENGTTGCFADQAVVPSAGVDSSTPGVQAVLQHWANPVARLYSKVFPASSIPRFQMDSSYLEMSFPSREFRILAAIKFWTTIDQFSPYKSVMDRPWGEALGDFIRSMDRVKDRPGYHLAVQAMAARLQDSHGAVTMATNGVDGPMILPDGVKALFGSGTFPAALAMIDGRPVVTRVWGDAPAKAGLRPGDEILAVDGENAKGKMDRIRPYIAASTPQRLDLVTANRMFRGPLGKAGVIQVRRPDGREETLAVGWSEEAPNLSQSWRLGPEFLVLPRNMGYVDLDRIAPDQIQPMMAAVKDTRALILDMRGYPSTGGWQAVNSFLKHPKATGALIEIPLILGEPEEGTDWRVALDQGVTPAKPSHYAGKVIMLMDERSQSSAEHAGLHLETGSDATFIGSPTSGANGNVTTMLLPGGLRIWFTGMSIRHADGRQLQRVGLQPHITVRPTIKGLAEGRDEVLERAVRFIDEGK